MDQKNKNYIIENQDRTNVISNECNENTTFLNKIAEVIEDQSGEINKPEEVEDVASFLLSIYSKNPGARMYMNHIESLFYQILTSREPLRHFIFPTMSSFQRLIVHRVADYFKMVHYLNSSSHVCVVRKANSIIPVPLRMLYENTIQISETQEQPKIRILKKPKDESLNLTENSQRSIPVPVKSLEERQESYLRARARIFELPLEDPDIVSHFGNLDVSQEEEKITPKSEGYKPSDDSQPQERGDVKLLFQKAIHDAANKSISNDELLSLNQNDDNVHSIVSSNEVPLVNAPHNSDTPFLTFSDNNLLVSNLSEYPQSFNFKYSSEFLESENFTRDNDKT